MKRKENRTDKLKPELEKTERLLYIKNWATRICKLQSPLGRTKLATESCGLKRTVVGHDIRTTDGPQDSKSINKTVFLNKREGNGEGKAYGVFREIWTRRR